MPPLGAGAGVSLKQQTTGCHNPGAALSGCQWRTRDWQNQQRRLSAAGATSATSCQCGGGIASRAILVGIEVMAAELEWL
jgi:hypothetical protein